MRKLMFILIAACLAQSVSAQPEARRREQRQAAAASANALSTRAQISFPTQAPMKPTPRCIIRLSRSGRR